VRRVRTPRYDSLPMSDEKTYAVPEASAARAWIDNRRYESLYRESLESPEAFWAKQARDRLDWIAPFSQVKDTSFDAKDLHVRWFADGKLNVSANCLDRHLAKRARANRDPVGARRPERGRAQDQLPRAAR
jgi:acetyl-CoA synthetase